jgi:biopolymer transport protein ExbD
MLSMAVHRSLPVSLPLSSQAQIDTAQSLTVTVTKNGDIFFNKKRFSLDEMQVALRAEAAKAATESGKTVMVTLFAHKDISYQKLYRVLDLIRTAGIANVSLQAGADK